MKMRETSRAADKKPLDNNYLKKQGKLFEECEKEFFKVAKEKKCSRKLVEYVWNVLFRVQRGYSFNLSHTLSYSMIALQEMNLCYKYPIIFWNTANLIVDSASTDGMDDNSEENNINKISEPESEIVSIYEPEDDDDYEYEDLPDRTGKIKKKVKTVDYGKISVALGKMKARGTNVSLPDINKSEYTFVPDAENSSILYGIKGITRISDTLVREIIQRRPYVSLFDFLQKVKVNKLQIVNLIKSGAFDNLEGITREEVMEKYIDSIADKKSRLTLQNMSSLINRNLIPEEMDFYRRLFNYNKYLKTCKFEEYYVLDDSTIDFYTEFFDTSLLYSDEKKGILILQKDWDKIYKKQMDPMRAYLKDPENDILTRMNEAAVKEMADKYSVGSVSKWEMDSIGFYFHPHELAGINKSIYGISDFTSLSENPIPITQIKSKNGIMIPIYDLDRIAGTVIKKDKTKHLITLLTETGTVNVKIWTAQFTKYDKQISVRQEDGKKKIMERSWFARGNKLLITGIRRGDNFIPKVYRNGRYKDPILLISGVNKDGTLSLRYNRYGEEE